MDSLASPEIQCGVAGVGYLGQHHARVYTELPGARLVGVYDADSRRAREIARRHSCEVFESLEALGQACEVVSIVTPTDTHEQVALELLGCGCHVLVEKPICPTLAGAGRIAEAARARDLRVQVGHIEHYNPVMAYLEKEVSCPRFITADRLAPFKERGTEVSVILDLMIHDIGIVLKLVKAPLLRVDAVGVSVLTSTIDIANARLSFEGGCVANLNTSRVSMKAVREIRIFQPEVYLSLDFAGQKGHKITQGKLPLSAPLNLKKQTVPIEKAEPLKVELQSFVDSVRAHTAPKVDAVLGTSALEVALEVSRLIQAS